MGRHIDFIERRAAAIPIVKRDYKTKSNAALAEETGLSRPVIRALRVELGLPPSDLKGPTGHLKRPARIQQISDLTDQGFNIHQIAAAIGITADTVGSLGRKAGIAVISRVGTTKKDANVLSQTMLDLDAISTSMRVLHTGVSGVTPEQAKEWDSILTEALSAFKNLRLKLRELLAPQPAPQSPTTETVNGNE